MIDVSVLQRNAGRFISNGQGFKQLSIGAKRGAGVASGVGVGLPEQSQNQNSQNIRNNSRAVNRTCIAVDNVTFVACLAEGINCSAQTQSRTERVTIIMKVAQRCIGMGEVRVDEINIVLTAVVQDAQSSCGGS